MLSNRVLLNWGTTVFTQTNVTVSKVFACAYSTKVSVLNVPMLNSNTTAPFIYNGFDKKLTGFSIWGSTSLQNTDYIAIGY